MGEKPSLLGLSVLLYSKDCLILVCVFGGVVLLQKKIGAFPDGIPDGKDNMKPDQIFNSIRRNVDPSCFTVVCSCSHLLFIAF